MQHLDTFLQQYQKEVLDRIELPATLGEYVPVSCLKDGKRSVFLVRGANGELYILKVQSAEEIASLFQEYKLLKSIDHPQVPKTIAYAEDNNKEYLVREYVHGLSLAELIVERGPVDESTCLSIVWSLGRVVDDLHACTPPLIHRDIKPQNVILSPEGTCYLVDFGTARQYKADTTEDTVTVGTRMTAPPEQFGYGQTDVRSDIYGIGMLMRYLLTGAYKPISIKSVSWSLRHIVGRCTAFDPDRRFSSVQKLRRALARYKRRKMTLCLGILAIALLAFILIMPNVFPGRSVEFSNPQIERAVRRELGLAENAVIPQKRLSEVTQLILCGPEQFSNVQAHEQAVWKLHDASWTTIPHGGIETLDDLSFLVNLRELVLDYQSIEELSPLQGLPLERISLVGNRITDISPLAACETLVEINLMLNPVSDIAPLATLPNLSVLNINETPVTSLDAFAGASIQTLCLARTPIIDYTPLLTMRHLQELKATEVNHVSLAVITQITSLADLTLYSTGFEDFSSFSKLQNLRYLDVYSCTFDRLDGLELLPALQALNVGETQTIELAPFVSIPALARLVLRGNEIEDYTPLLDCQRLVWLCLEESQRTLAEAQLAEAPFEIEIMAY